MLYFILFIFVAVPAAHLTIWYFFGGMKAFVITSILFVSLFWLNHDAFAQALPVPTENMQKAVGGIIQQTAASRGFAANDPRIHSTLYSIGKTTAVIAGTAGAGLLVAGTAPAWATVLGVVAVQSALMYAIPLGVDAAVQWTFGAGPTPIQTTTTTLTGSAVWAKPEGGECQIGIVTNHCAWDFGSNTPVLGAPGSFEMCLSPGMSNPTNACAAGGGMTGIGASTGANLLRNAGFSDTPKKTIDVVAGRNLQTASDAMTEPQRQEKIDYGTLARLINELHKQAAADPEYKGLPYQQTNPITEADAKTWANANPNAYPSIDALINPVSNPSTSFAPSGAPNSSGAAQPVTSPSPAGSINPGASQPEQNLGVDPVTGAPALEATPTPLEIFQPFITMTKPLSEFKSILPAGECYRPSMEVFGTTHQFDSYCDLMAQHRETVGLIMTALFWAMALLIIFSA